jgi:hypothetical protein
MYLLPRGLRTFVGRRQMSRLHMQCTIDREFADGFIGTLSLVNTDTSITAMPAPRSKRMLSNSRWRGFEIYKLRVVSQYLSRR